MSASSPFNEKVIPSLGRSLSIGDVINSCNDEIVSGEKLWPDIDKSVVKEIIQESSVKTCTSIEEMYENLGIDTSTRIHIELEFIENEGFAKALLMGKGGQKKDIGMAIVHEYRAKKESVEIATFKTLDLDHVDTLKSGTHVVTGITYGCFAVFWGKEKHSGHKEVTSMESLEELANAMPYQGKITSCEGDEEKDCTIVDAVYQMRAMIENIQKDQHISAIPIKYHLCPIECLLNTGARTFFEISPPIASRTIAILDDVKEVDYAYNKLQDSPCIKEFKAIKQSLTEFKDCRYNYLNEKMEALKDHIPGVHEGATKVGELEKLLKLIESSPFNGKSLKEWIAVKKKELEQLQNALHQFKAVPIVQTTAKLKKEISVTKNGLLCCFVIQIPKEDKVVEQMRQHLFDEDKEDDEEEPEEEEDEERESGEKEEEGITDHGRNEEFQLITLNFQSLIERYQNDPKIKFVLYFEKADVRAMKAVTHLYEDGKLTDNAFVAPCQPFGLGGQEVNDTSLEIKWKVQENSCQNEEYKVIVLGPDQDATSYTSKKTNFIVPNLKPETEYEIKVIAFMACIESKPSPSLKVTTLKSDVTSPPGKPLFYEMSYPMARLEWAKPVRISQPILEYRIHESEDVHRTVDGNTQNLDIKISPNKSYVFTVQADCGKHGMSRHSIPSDLFFKEMSPNDITKENIKAESTLISKVGESPKLYQLKLKTTHKNKMLRKCTFGDEAFGVPKKVVMLLGATGSGKTTLINGIINYIVGVRLEDDFRLKLISDEGAGSQAKSQTSEIIAYTIHHQAGFNVKYTLILVDTPGFGDTSGITRDKEITSQIDHFFRADDGSGLDHIDGIGFVTQSALARLTPTQQYIFDSILSLFGKDIESFIFPLLTFADGKEPQALSSLEAANIPFKKYFKFNNSALFADNRVKSKFNELFWEMGESGFADLIDSITKTNGMSLNLTKEVLSERETLESQVQGINSDVKRGLNKLEQLHKEWNVIQEHESEIKRNENFTYTVEEEKSVKIDLKAGEYTTNCLHCNRTCHYPCGIPDDDRKAGCAAMEWGIGKDISDICCEVCPGKCTWKLHKNMQYIFDTERVTVTRTSEDLEKRYRTAKGEKVSCERILEGIINDIEETHIDVARKTIQIRKCVARLAEIALKPNPLSTIEYVKIMIHAERTEAKPGWEERIKQLEEVKQTAEFIDKVVKKGIDPFKDYEGTLQLVRGYYKDKKEKTTIFQKIVNFVTRK